jgi:hypothetical protein
MSERIVGVVREKPKRSLGFAALIAVIVLLVSGFSGTSGAVAKGRVIHGAVAGTASLTPAQINSNVDRLLGQMTAVEKFGQLEMAGPSTPNGSDLIPLAEQGKIGSVLDLTGVATSTPFRPPLLIIRGSTSR